MRAAAAEPVLAMDRLRLRVAAGVPPDDAAHLPERGRRAVAVAQAVGAPMLEAIDGAQAAEDDAARARRAVAVASAQTKAVATGLLIAPVILVPALGRLVGADLVGFYTSGLGLLVLGVGAALLAVGGLLVVVLVRRVGRAADARPADHVALAVAAGFAVVIWRLVGPVPAPLGALVAHRLVTHRLARRPQAAPAGVDEAADLAATALTGGVSAPEALRVVADHLPALAPHLRRLAFGLELGMSAEDLDSGASGAGAGRTGRTGRTGPASRPTVAAPSPRRAIGRTQRAPSDGLLRLAGVLTTAEELGAPVAPTLRRLAADLRADELARVLAAAERLPAQLTFPTALCLLPATLLLVGAPIVQAGLAAAGT